MWNFGFKIGLERFGKRTGGLVGFTLERFALYLTRFGKRSEMQRSCGPLLFSRTMAKLIFFGSHCHDLISAIAEDKTSKRWLESSNSS